MAVTYPILRMSLNNTDIEIRSNSSDVAGAFIDCEVLQETHPISLELPASRADILLYTEDPRFSIFSDGEFYSALSKNVPATLLVSVDGVETLVGRFFLDQWYAPTEKQIKFEFVDAIGVFANTEYPGSFWAEATPISAVIAEILNPIGLPYIIAANVVERTVKGWIPPGKVREALQQVCFAARCLVNTAKSDTVQIADALLPLAAAKPPFGYYGSVTYGDGTLYNAIALKPAITEADKTNAQKLTHLPMVTEVTLHSHEYYHPADGVQTAEEIYNAWLEPGDYVISYPKPYWKVWADGVGSVPVYITTEDGRVIATEDSGATWATGRVATESETFAFYSNYMVIKVLTAGTIKVWGYPWLENIRSHRYSEASASSQLVQGFYYGDPGKPYGNPRYSKITILTATPNTISVEKATLVSPDLAALVLAKVVEYYKLRYQQNVRLFPNPAANLGDIQVVDSLYGKDIIGITEKLVSDLTGGFLIEAEIVGLERTGS
jgi:hypothetical protein